MRGWANKLCGSYTRGTDGIGAVIEFCGVRLCGLLRIAPEAAIASGNKKAAEQIRFAAWYFAGGDDGDRTHDLNIANVALSQLSYIPSGY